MGVFFLWSIAGKPSVICLSTDRLYRSMWTSGMKEAGRERHDWSHTALWFTSVSILRTPQMRIVTLWDILCIWTAAGETDFGKEALQSLWVPGLQQQRGLWCDSVYLCHAYGCGLSLRCIFLLSLACADVWSSEAGTWLGIWYHLDWRGRIRLSCPGEGALGWAPNGLPPL